MFFNKRVIFFKMKNYLVWMRIVKRVIFNFSFDLAGLRIVERVFFVLVRAILRLNKRVILKRR